MNSGKERELQPDELVMSIEIQWSDSRTNEVTRTLNEVSILERDMRHGKTIPHSAIIPRLSSVHLFRTAWHEKRGYGWRF